MEGSQKLVESLLGSEISGGIPSTRIVLGGFSQGAAVSLFTGLQYAQPLGGILALSGYMPYNKPAESLAPLVAAAANAATPVLQCHGEADGMISLPVAQRSFDKLKAVRKDNLTFKSYKVSCRAQLAAPCRTRVAAALIESLLSPPPARPLDARVSLQQIAAATN